MSSVQKTPLHAHHVKLGGKMVPFAGWEMPIEYSGILKEHTAVRNAVGLFDVTHMGEIEVKGGRALDFCQRVATNDASTLKPGKVQYSAILNESGGILDDCTLYRLALDHFVFVVNACNRSAVSAHFQSQSLEGAEVLDRSDEWGLLALQGKGAESLLSRVVKRDLATVGYYEFIWVEVLESAVMISRTGYTGEDGFEIYVPMGKLVSIWEKLIEEGGPCGLVPIGLGARDTLRLEMGYLLHGQDMTTETTPWEVNLGWIVKMNKGSFSGRDALAKQKEAGVPRSLRALRMKERGIPRPGYPVGEGDQEMGQVTSGTHSPTLKSGVALALVDGKPPIGTELWIDVRGKKLMAEVVKPPFVSGSVKK